MLACQDHFCQLFCHFVVGQFDGTLLSLRHPSIQDLIFCFNFPLA